MPADAAPAVHSTYGRTAADTVAAAAGVDPPVPVEAPAGQYDACVELMKHDDRTADPPVVAGAYTYEQAANLARGGKVEALTFDAGTGRVGCRSPKGVTEAVRHAQTVWAESYGDVEREADAEDWGGVVGSAVGAGTSAVGSAVGWVWGQAKGRAVKRLARLALGKNPAALMVAAGPSVYRALVTGETSYRQATKDLFEAGTGAAGGAAGAAAGAAFGAAVGSIVPVFGTFVGGAVGGLTGGIMGATTAERGGELLADAFAPDDADALRPLADDELAALAFRHALVPAEVARLRDAAHAVTTERTLRRWFRLYNDAAGPDAADPAAGERAVRTAARDAYEPALREVLVDRPPVPLPVP